MNNDSKSPGERTRAREQSVADDITMAAAQMFGVDPADVTLLQRRAAKSALFGAHYGSSGVAKTYEQGRVDERADVVARLLFMVAHLPENACISPLEISLWADEFAQGEHIGAAEKGELDG